jgi:hypothetical protein
VYGTFGLDAFKPFVVEIDWLRKRMYLTPSVGEAATRDQRLARWGTRLPPCARSGCVTLEHDGDVLKVIPDPGVEATGIEVVVAATEGPHELPRLDLNIPKGTRDRFDVRLRGEYADAFLEVVDVTPDPRGCAGGLPCAMIEEITP